MDPDFHVISATFNHKFTKFSQLRQLTQSPACWIQNLPWKIFIEPVFQYNKKYLSIFVGCAPPITTHPWSCRASVRTYKLDGTKPKIIRTTKFLVFDSEASTSWGHDNFILWDTVLNPANGFIKNDTITIEISIDAEVPVGIKLTEKYFTDERANSAIKLRDQTISNLQSNIQGITEQNANLRSTNQTSSNEIEELKNLLNFSQKKSADLEKQYKDEQNLNNELKKTTENQLKLEKDKNDTFTKISKENNATIVSLTERIKVLEENEDKLTNCNNEKEDIQKKYSSLLDEFEKYKSTISNNESQNGRVLKTEIEALKKKNAEIQNALKDASTKLNQNEEEQLKIQTNIDSISKELTEAKSITETIKKEATDEHQKIQAEKTELQTQIQSLKSQLYESLVKHKISQDMNEEIEKLKTENDKIKNQMQIGYEKYNKLRQEEVTLKSQIETLNKQLSDANDINNPTTNTKKLQVCKDELAQSKASNTESQTTNENLRVKSNGTQSEMKYFVNIKEHNQLKTHLEAVEKELKELKETKTDSVIAELSAEKLQLEKKLIEVNKELEDKKVQLLKSKNEINEMLDIKQNISILQTQLDTTKNELKKIKDKKLDEVISKFNNEKTSIKRELEESKIKLNNTLIQTTRIARLEDENVKLKEHITTLQKLREETNHDKQTLNDQKIKNGNGDERKVRNKGPDFEVDLVKGTKNKKQEPIQKIQVGKTTRSSGEEKVDDFKMLQKKNSIERRIETLRKQFETDIKEADNALHYEREYLSKKVDELMNRLGVEKQKLEDSNENQSKFKGEISRLKEETNTLKGLKDKSYDQLKTIQNICVELFHLILHILKNMKTSGKLSCSLEAHIISSFTTMKQNGLWSLANHEEFFDKIENQQHEISTDTLRTKLVQLQTHYEESLDIIRKNCALENNENTNLRTANKELLVIVENEKNMNKLYKEMLNMANSRLGDFRKQLTLVGNQFLDEKVKRYECEETSRTSRESCEGNEMLLNDLKEKLLRHAIKLSDIKDIDLPKMFHQDSGVSRNNVGATMDTSTNTEPVEIESLEAQTQTAPNTVEKLELKKKDEIQPDRTSSGLEGSNSSTESENFSNSMAETSTSKSGLES